MKISKCRTNFIPVAKSNLAGKTPICLKTCRNPKIGWPSIRYYGCSATPNNTWDMFLGSWGVDPWCWSKVVASETREFPCGCCQPTVVKLSWEWKLGTRWFVWWWWRRPNRRDNAEIGVGVARTLSGRREWNRVGWVIFCFSASLFPFFSFPYSDWVSLLLFPLIRHLSLFFLLNLSPSFAAPPQLFFFFPFSSIYYFSFFFLFFPQPLSWFPFSALYDRGA